MPIISVIVPVYKVEPYLRRCVDSILNQTYSDFELILVDDGSPDNCGAICDEYAAKDSRVHVIHQENGGLSAARNAGIDWAFANSDSEWIYFADSDDWIHPKSLEALLDGAAQTRLSVVIGGYERTDGDTPIVDEDALSTEVWDTETYFCEHNVNAIVAWGKIYRKECFENIRYPVGKISEDEFTTYKILFEYDKLAVIDQPLYAYYQNPEGIMGQSWTPKRLEYLKAFEGRIEYFKTRHNANMYLFSIRHLFDSLLYQISCMQSGSSIERFNICILRKTLKKYFRKYNNELPILQNKNVYRPTLEYLYPKTMWLYRKVKSLRSMIGDKLCPR